MTFMHYGEGTIERLGLNRELADFVLATGRIATPAFIAIFGLAAGLAYLGRFTGDRRRQVTHRLLIRGLWLLPCVLLVRIDRVTMLCVQGEWDPFVWMLDTYSVLSFYVLGVLSMPFYLRLFQNRGWWWPALTGLTMWAAGTALVDVVWPKGETTWINVCRMYVVAGPYPYLQMMGTALVFLPVGAWIKQANDGGRLDAAMPMLAVAGLTAAGVGLALGYGAESGLELSKFAQGIYKVPVRPWYFLFFTGLTLFGLTLLQQTNRLLGNRFAMHWLAIWGTYGLTLYVVQALIQPGLESLDHIILIEGVWRVLLAATVLVVAMSVILVKQNRKEQRLVATAQT